jgi:3-deoxy-D-manno-octulosonate 8-phosphate phosphatase (KDO 8-P phosphatase)
MLNSIHTIVFDFDGVFTDNFVYTDSNGIEHVKTSRSDSYGLSNFREFCVANSFNIEMFILSTETNKVVTQRALKLGLTSHIGVSGKKDFLSKYLTSRGLPSSRGLIFLGNDLNDLECLEMAEFSFCPSDAHETVKKVVTHPLNCQGGNGFVREALEFLTLSTLIKG